MPFLKEDVTGIQLLSLQKNRKGKQVDINSEAGEEGATLCIPTPRNLLTQWQLSHRENTADYHTTCTNPCDFCKVSQNLGRQPTGASKFVYV